MKTFSLPPCCPYSCASTCECLRSGMLPGYVSGFYSYDECHVDLNRLARYANGRMILQPATGLDLKVYLCVCVCVCQSELFPHNSVTLYSPCNAAGTDHLLLCGSIMSQGQHRGHHIAVMPVYVIVSCACVSCPASCSSTAAHYTKSDSLVCQLKHQTGRCFARRQAGWQLFMSVAA